MASSITYTDLDLLVRTIIGEAAQESAKGKRAVAAVALNRLKKGTYGKTLSDVLLAKNQFEPWDKRKGELLAYSAESPEYLSAAAAAADALAGDDPTGGAVNFYSPTAQAALGRETPDWAVGEHQDIGRHRFYGGDVAQASDTDLLDEFGIEVGPAAEPITVAPGLDDMELLQQFGIGVEEEQPKTPVIPGPLDLENKKRADGTAAPLKGNVIGEGIARGVEDVLSTVADAVSYGVEGGAQLLSDVGVISPETMEGVRAGEKRGREWSAERNRMFEAAHANDPAVMDFTIPFGDKGIRVNPSAAALSRFGGQLAATGGPATKAAISGGNLLMKIAPGLKPTGVVSRAVQGITAGATGAGMVSSVGEESVAKQMYKGGILGGGLGVVGPPVAKAFKGSIKAIFGPSSRGPSEKSLDVVSDMLESSGTTPQEIKAAIQARGPKTVVADMNEALAAEARALAARGGKATQELKGSMNRRGAEADPQMAADIDATLGPKPDITKQTEAINRRAGAVYEQLHDVAVRTAPPINVNPVVRGIDKDLRSAVGAEKNVLGMIRNWLRDPQMSKSAGKDVFKSDLDDLIKVRRAISGWLEKPPAGAGSDATRAARNLRKAIDERIKKASPAQKKADELYSGEKSVTEGIEYGRNIFSSKVSVEDAKAMFNGASQDVKDGIILGARHHIGEAIEQAAAGEAAAATRLLGKGSAMREKLKMLYGAKADEMLDKIGERIAQLRTERHVAAGSATAESTAIGKKWDTPSGANKMIDVAGTLGGFALGGTFAPGIGHAVGAAVGGMGAHAIRAGLEKIAKKAGQKIEGEVAKMLAASGDDGINLMDAIIAHRASKARGAGNKLTNLGSAGAGLSQRKPLQLDVRPYVTNPTGNQMMLPR